MDQYNTINEVNCFLPCRQGSERIPNKNIKPFADILHGLIEIKLNQLTKTKLINKIYLSTNDDEIISFAESLKNKKIIIHKRDEILSSSQASTDQLIEHAFDLIGNGHILWTHVTSPFVNSTMYDLIIKKYFCMLHEDYDSLMTVNLIYDFLWDNSKPINYDRKKEKWPRTQTLVPVYEVNSAVFLASSNIYEKQRDRIGTKPYLYPMDKFAGKDIDWPEDFAIAEILYKNKLADI